METDRKLVDRNTAAIGIVYFVGAGPGDPDLITLKAQKLIAQADVIVYAGSLVNPEILAYARPEAERHNSADMKLSEQVAVMSDAAARGRMVVRLHTGDPSIYGATLEQMRELDKKGIPYAVVPGVSSVFAAAAALGIEYTVPGDTQTVILTRLSGRTPVPDREALKLLAEHRSSLVVFLSAGMISNVVDQLLAAGYTSATPVAVVYRASWPDELVIRSTLGDIVQRLEAAQITHHALIIVSPALDEDRAKGELAEDSHLYGTALAEPQRDSSTAIVTLTRGGTRTGQRLHALLPDSVLYAPSRFLDDAAGEQERVVPFTVSVRQILQSAFGEHQAMICIMASGIVVRELAPLFRSKHTDPPIVVLDENGQYAVSLIGGHKGGGNALARRVAELLGGTAVLTTSSDVQGLPALDLLGRGSAPSSLPPLVPPWTGGDELLDEVGPGRRGEMRPSVSSGPWTGGPRWSEIKRPWVLRRGAHMTAVSAALVNGEPVGVWQEAGDESWWPDPVPENLVRYPTLRALSEAAPAAAVIITYRRVPPDVYEAIPESVVYYPPCLTVGVGCNRGTAGNEIEEAIEQTLAEGGLEILSVSRLATIEDKEDEAGLQEVANAHGWPVQCFSREEIAQVTDLPNPSEWALKVLGVPGVAEPAALLGAGATSLLIEKHKFANVTVAVALDARSTPAERGEA